VRAAHHYVSNGKSLPLVVLEPGHEGKYPGKIGVSGTNEKRVAVGAAGLIRRHLEASGKCSVRLTRQRDGSIPPSGRVAIVEWNGGSFLISIHADALAQRDVEDASAYMFGLKTSDPDATPLAERENRSDRFASLRYRRLRPAVRQTLSSLVVEETKIGSATMQGRMVRNLRPHTQMLQILRSVSVEKGFISNRMDERLLRQTRHRTAIAAAMSGAATNSLDNAHNLMLLRS